MVFAADKDLLLSLTHIAKYINDMGHKINIQYAIDPNIKTKIITPFLH